MELGDLTKKYESGNLGPAAISNDPGDPGGASYGTYQLSANTGTLDSFLRHSGYLDAFVGLKSGTLDFNREWELECNDPKFVQAQHDFIQSRLYQPVRDYATIVSIMATTAINETIWSMAVQHGRAKHIIDMAATHESWDVQDETATINCLYDARCDYVDSLGMSYLKIRYHSERKDILNAIN